MTDDGEVRELVLRAQEGDREAFDRLAERFTARLRDSLRRWTRFQLGPPVDCEDVLQDSLVRAFRSLSRFGWQGDDAFFRWLCGIAKCALAQAVRDVRRHQGRRAGAETLVEHRAASGPSQSTIVRREERFERLKLALEKLEPDRRDVLLLSRIEGLSLKEIAARTGRTVRQVKYLLACALRDLSARFGTTESFCLPDRRLEQGGAERDS